MTAIFDPECKKCGKRIFYAYKAVSLLSAIQCIKKEARLYTHDRTHASFDIPCRECNYRRTKFFVKLRFSKS